MPNVETPDGKIIEFPEAMSTQEINAVLDKQYGGGKPSIASSEPTDERSFMGNVGHDLSKRAGNAADIFTGNVPADETLYGSVRNAPMRLFQLAGQGAGFVNDVAGETLKAVYKTVVPESTQKSISSTLGELASNPVIKGGAETLSDIYTGAKKRFPEGVRTLEAAANIAGAIPAVKGVSAAAGATKAMGKEGANIVKDIASIASKTAEEGIARKVDNAIRYGVEKSIRPSVVGKGNATQIAAYHDRAVVAVKNIVANKDNLALTDADGNIVKGALPKSLNQFSEAVDQTKKGIFRQYDDMAKQAGDSGATVDLLPLSDEIAKLSESKVTKVVSPEVAKYAELKAAAFKDAGSFTTEEAQEAVAQLNKSLEAYYRNPTYETASKAGIDAIVANNLRKSLDAAIENATGEGYQALKKSYGALKSIEKDVAHRAIVDARKNVKGLLDFTDIFTSGELLAGLATFNPSMVLRAGAWKSVKEYFKIMNNPNRVVREMFGDVEKILDSGKSGYKSQSLQYLAGGQ
jgi:hypothetical protein